MKKQKYYFLAIIGGFGFATWGCADGFIPFLSTADPELSPGLEWLKENQEDYWIPLDFKRPEGEIATAEEFEEGLEGCWASVQPAGGEIPVMLFLIDQFDVSERRFTSWALQVIPLGFGFQIVSKDVGTFEFIDVDGRPALEYSVEQSWVSDPYTGKLTEEAHGDLTQGYYDPIFVEDRLYLRLSLQDEDWWNYRRMECVE